VASADLERMQNLLKEGAVSPRDVDKAQAALKAAQASAAAATKRLDEATVRAPVSGVIAERMVQSGDRVGDGDPLFRLVNISELEFEATVPSDDAALLRPGLPVELTVTGTGSAPVAGVVARVNATADPATRQVKVYVRVPNANGRWVGDLYATGRIVLDQAKQVLSIPSAGVHADSTGKSFVWIVSDGRAQDRPVEIGVRDDRQDRIEVREGLQAGELAIVGPIEGLAPGQPVQAPGGDQ
jgi:membrane fusion protein (multidrug efflux system)